MGTIKWVALRLCPNRTIAALGTTIGRQAGLRTRRCGAARTSRWGAQKPRLSRTIATLGTTIGRQVGPTTRRFGAARTRKGGAHEEPGPILVRTFSRFGLGLIVVGSGRSVASVPDPTRPGQGFGTGPTAGNLLLATYDLRE